MHLKIERKRTKSKRNFSWLQRRQKHLILTLADCKSPQTGPTLYIVKYSGLYFTWKLPEKGRVQMTTKKKLRISFAILLILLFLNVFFFTDYIWIEKTLMIGTIIVLLILIFHDNKKG